MTELQKLDKIGTDAVRRLRLKKLHDGFPFMINSRELPSDQCYFEYPNGSIKLMVLQPSARDFKIIRELSEIEALKIREKYNLAI
ncbi:MAG TPA: hypothetical protein VM802_04255 [Chitinophaga sp.]|uniref:hypothetical protein n=1 Tax=Chitinophaga sp. TaxID=1869181 RepID=UPI002BF12811|nr:hypothetical protein [Chitinophaga sp.]HVI44050.1 hypothetical protein [Chitinophaga sp.]